MIRDFCHCNFRDHRLKIDPIKINMTNIAECSAIMMMMLMMMMIIMVVDRAEALEEVGLILSVYCCFPGEKGEVSAGFFSTLLSLKFSKCGQYHHKQRHCHRQIHKGV